MRSLLASPLGLLIGVSLGALGGGGSILAVPALVYGAGQSASQATTTSLVVVAVTALIAIGPHWRAGQVKLTAGALFGVAGIGGSLLGSHWNTSVDPDALLLGFSALMMVAAYGMLSRTGSPTESRPTDAPQPRTLSAASATVLHAPHFRAATMAKVAGAGSVVGLLTGFFGVGGGFVIVPALVLALEFTMSEAIGTSLLVITINSIAALSTRLDAGTVQWGTVIVFTVASMVGVAIGTRIARTRDPRALQRWFGVLLVVVATYTALDSALALT